MPVFSLNIVLMLIWVILTADFTESNLVQGFIIGWVVLWFARHILGDENYFKKPIQIASLTGYFLTELLSSSLRVAWDVLTPRERANPGFVRVPLDAATEAQILLLSNLISLTPGTLSLDISEDRKTLLMHIMFLDDEETLIANFKELEKRVIEVTS